MTNEQHTSRPDITLDWADVEAWVKTHDKKLKPYQNSYGGYNIDCPIPTHQLKDQRLSIRPMKDGNVFLKCFGGCNYQDVRAAIAKEIKSSATPVTEPQFVQAPSAPHQPFSRRNHPDEPSVVQARTAPQLEALEREWYSPEAQLALDQLVDEQLAEEQTAEYWETQATEAKAELEQECTDRVAAEKERDKAHEAREAAEAELENRTNSEITAGQLQKSVNDLRDDKGRLETKLDEKEDEFDVLQKDKSKLEKKLCDTTNQHNKRVEELERKALTFDFIAAWGNLEDALEPLKKDLIQDYQRSGQSSSIAERRASITSQLDKAHQEDYIDEDQCLDLKNMYTQRNNIAHRGHPLTSKLARAYLEILLPVIDQLRQYSRDKSP